MPDESQERVRYYQIAGITIKVESDLPFTETTFDRRFESFLVEGPGDDTVTIRHHFRLPSEDLKAGGEEVYRRPPWAIWRMPDGSWVYEGIAPEADEPRLHRLAVFTEDHRVGDLYDLPFMSGVWRRGGLHSLTLFPSDQVWIARLLADRGACYLHSAAIVLSPSSDCRVVGSGLGFLFVGHSEAGKSTTVELLRRELGGRLEILCDDRNIVRWGPDGFRLYGTWSHGDVGDVSSSNAPLRAILFLEQSDKNELVALTDRKLIWSRLLATLIRPLVTAEWLEKEFDVLERLVDESEFYIMRFDKTGRIVDRLAQLALMPAVTR